jgi:16S rRNA (cytosine1402-N4)-methyltransferase
METKHKSVLLKETIDSLMPINVNGTYVDVTLGGGGHSKEILKQLVAGKLIVFDLDQSAINNFKGFLTHELNFKELANNEFTDGKRIVVLHNANFSNIIDYVKEKVDGIVADLGFATDQLDTVRGLSFLKNEELDMRMDKSLKVKALDLINGLYIKELESLFTKFGDVSFAKTIAKEIAKIRTSKPITKTGELNAIVKKIVPPHMRKGDNKHPEAKVYQALRIAVNDERNSLISLLKNGFEILKNTGRLAVLSFHSGEDRIVKNDFRERVEQNIAKHHVKRIETSEEEIKNNNNSRSAKLRVIEKI